MLQFRDCKGGFIWRRLWAWILWGKVLGNVTGKTKTGGGVRSSQVKHLSAVSVK